MRQTRFFMLLLPFALSIFGACSGLPSLPLPETPLPNIPTPPDPTPTEPTEIRNPVLEGDHPDPHVLRLDLGGSPTYFMTHTSSFANIPLFESKDLVHWEYKKGLFNAQKLGGPSSPLVINGKKFCHIWGPEILQMEAEEFLLTFTAVEHDGPATEDCAPYLANSKTFFATSKSVRGPFAKDLAEPMALSALLAASCPHSALLPLTPASNQPGCGGRSCDLTPRTDGSLYLTNDGNRFYFFYSWYNYDGSTLIDQNLSMLRMDPVDPRQGLCDPVSGLPELIVSGSDPTYLLNLANSSSYGNLQLQFNLTRQGTVGNHSVSEAPSVFRTNGYTYLLLSNGLWDSPTYQVNWVAAPHVWQLKSKNPQRLSGRYLIPDLEYGMNFGHGTPILSPDNKTYYLLHHSMDDQRACAANLPDGCRRSLWLNEIEFEDKGDGLGAVHIKPKLMGSEESRMVKIRHPLSD